MFYYFRRFRELGFREGTRQARELLTRVFVRAGERIYNSYLRSQPTPADVLKLCSFSSTAALSEHFIRRKIPLFFFDDALDAHIDDFRLLFPDQTKQIIQEADLVMEHKFDLLGSGRSSLGAGGSLPWQVDFKSGASWKADTYYTNIRYGDVHGVDVKVPWELSRFHHLVTLGQAYRLKKEERYAKEFVGQIEDWIDSNPCRHGVNWSCTMEAGIRAVNWIWAFYLFKDSGSIDGGFLLKFLTSLYTHAGFIRRNLEYREAWIDGRLRRLNSNHYLSDLVGLLYIAVLFPEFRLTEEAKFAASELEIELFEETFPDGTDYEHSTFYHRFVLEIFMSGFLLLELNGSSMSPAIAERLERMADFVAACLRPDGTAPQIGDSDDGRLHPLSVRDHADHRYLPLMAAQLFGRHDLRLWGKDPEVWWWLGPRDSAGREQDHTGVLFPGLRQPRPHPTAATKQGAFADSGFYIIRGHNVHVFISAATVGMHGEGSHSHNDLLSFEYWYNNQSWIVDPGTYVYTPDAEARNLFRSTQYHNTVRIDEEEINRFHPARLFQMADEAKVMVRERTSGADIDVLDVEHTGYLRLSQGVRHRRRFHLVKSSASLTIEDFFEGSGEHRFEWFFHLDPSVSIQPSGTDFVLGNGRQQIVVHTGDGPIEREITEGWHSPSYGVRKPARIIALRLRATVPLSTKVTIVPARTP